MWRAGTRRGCWSTRRGRGVAATPRPISPRRRRLAAFTAGGLFVKLDRTMPDYRNISIAITVIHTLALHLEICSMPCGKPNRVAATPRPADMLVVATQAPCSRAPCSSIRSCAFATARLYVGSATTASSSSCRCSSSRPASASAREPNITVPSEMHGLRGGSRHRRGAQRGYSEGAGDPLHAHGRIDCLADDDGARPRAGAVLRPRVRLLELRGHRRHVPHPVLRVADRPVAPHEQRAPPRGAEVSERRERDGENPPALCFPKIPREYVS